MIALAVAVAAAVTGFAKAGASPSSSGGVAKTTIAGTMPIPTSTTAPAGPTTATSAPVTAMPTTVPVDTVPAGFVRVNDDTRRIRVVVPDNWTDTETFPAMTDDGRDRPKIIASPDIAAMFETWTTPGVWFGAVPPPADPAAWLAAFTFESACMRGATEPFDNGRVAGVKESWINCGGGTAAVIHVAGRSADGTFGAFVQMHVPSPDDPVIATVLGSFGLVPGAAITAPTSVNSATVTTIGPADPTLAGNAPADARRIVDDTGQIAMSVPASFVDDDPSSDLNDDASDRPFIASAPDLAAHYSQWTAVGLQAVRLPYSDPATVLVNRVFPGCTDSGIQPFSNGRYSGFMRTWTGCGGTEVRVIEVAMSPPDASATVLVYAQLPDADNTPLVTALATVELL